MPGPSVTICIPVHVRRTYLEGCLTSCLAQDYDNLGIVVLDDTPDDSLARIVREIAGDRVSYRHFADDAGLIGKLNRFLADCRTDWALIVCDDDLVSPSAVSRLVAAAEAERGTALVRSRYELIDADGRSVGLDRAAPERSSATEFLREIFQQPKATSVQNLTGVLFRPAALRELGGFRPFHKGIHSDRIAWAMLGAGGPVRVLPDPLVKIRLHGGSLSSERALDYEAYIATNLDMRGVCTAILADAGRRYTGDDDRQNLAIAAERLEAYVQRSLARSLDRGYVAALCLRGPDRRRHLARLADLVREIRPRGLRSLALYRVLEYAPAAIAARVLGVVVPLKQALVLARSRHAAPGARVDDPEPSRRRPVTVSSS